MSGSQPRLIEIEASSVEDAIQEGLDELGLTRAEVKVELLEDGSRGLLGLGKSRARVRLTEIDSSSPAPAAPAAADPPAKKDSRPEKRKPAPRAARKQAADEPADDELRIASEAIRELLDKMQIRADITTHRGAPSGDDEPVPWVLDIEGEDLGVLIGRRGETLNALQYIARLIVSRDIERRASFVIDVEGYKTRREEVLRKLARRMAEQALDMGRMVKLEPMPPHERRIIHIELRDDPDVVTESEGMGDSRKVTIKPAG